MDEAELVASIAAGDHAGLAEALDRYSASLFTFCRTMLPVVEAADAVENTFVIARVKLDGLRDPGKLDAWLTAVARRECFRRLAANDELPPAFISEVPDEPVPAGLRGKILKVCTEDTATARAHRTSVAHQAGPFGHDGFPKQAVAPRIARFGRRAKAGAAAVAVLAIAVTAAALLTGGSHPPRSAAAGHAAELAPGGPATSPITADTALPSQPPHSPAPDTSLRVARLTSSSPAVAPVTAPVTVPGPATDSPTPTPGAQSPAAAPRTSTTSGPPAQGTLQLSVAVISLLSVGNRPATAAITLTAVGGPIAAYSVTVSSGAPGDVIVSPRSGSIAAGQQVVVTVLGHSRKSFTAYLTFSPGGQVVVVHVKARK